MNISHALVLKKITFEAAHYIPGYDGKCASVHGHSYQLLNLKIPYNPYELDDKGLSTDFGIIKRKVKEYIDSSWDHKMIIPGHSPHIHAWRQHYKILGIPDNLVVMEYTSAEAIAAIIALHLSKILGLEPEEISFELLETGNQGVIW